MIIEHPWKTYATTAALSALTYYLIIGWRFFRQDIRDWIERREQPKSRHSAPLFAPYLPTGDEYIGEDNMPFQEASQLDENQPPAWQNEELFETAQALMNHLNSEIKEAYDKNYSKQDLLLMLQMILKDYTALKNTAFQTAVNDCINTECAKYGSIHLSEGETFEVWSMVV